MTFRPLNPTLFRLLELRFGQVDIVAQGQGIVWEVINRRAAASRFKQEKKNYAQRHVVHSGEEYKVSCPFCGDIRQRLYINHRWAVYDPETNSRNLFLCQCFNESCMDGYTRQSQLAEQVFAPAPSKRDGRFDVERGRNSPAGIAEMAPPGPLISMEQVATRAPRHPAIAFLEDRFFDPVKISRMYDISYCPQSRFSLAQNRIIIPMYHNGLLAGWQARYIGDPPRGVAKYWSCPGMARRLLAYNFDIAVQHQTVVIEEGPTDVWSTGPQGMGLLGKTMNQSLVLRFYEALSKYGDDQTVVVMLDPEQDEIQKRKGKPHHIDKVVDQLASVGLGDRVFGLLLPLGSDPGSLEREFQRELIRKKARDKGLKVSFTKPRELCLNL